MELSVGIKVAVRGLEWDVTEVLPLGVAATAATGLP